MLSEIYHALLNWWRTSAPPDLKNAYWYLYSLYLGPWFYLGVGSIFLLERLAPASPNQKVFSPGMVQDFVWFNFDLLIKSFLFPIVIFGLSFLYTAATGNFTLELLDGWPLGWKILVSFLVFDLLLWVDHRIRHKVDFLWHFHAIHHSQRELNLFTELRNHWFEYVVSLTITFVPLRILGFSPTSISTVALVLAWSSRVHHANIRTNFGLLKHILVTPQSHRIHHSIEARHQDKNFGSTLMIWDRLFGTMHSVYDEYPDTGVVGTYFPPPTRWSPLAWLKNYWEQNAHPFRQVFRRKSER